MPQNYFQHCLESLDNLVDTFWSLFFISRYVQLTHTGHYHKLKLQIHTKQFQMIFQISLL